MALTLKTETLNATTGPTFEALRNRSSHRSSDDEIAIDPLCLTRDVLNELLLAACSAGGEFKQYRCRVNPTHSQLARTTETPGFTTKSAARQDQLCYNK